MDTIFEIDEIDTPQPETVQEEKPKKKEPKIKKKKEMSEERKQKLREQLSRGRKTLADKRAKKKAEAEPKKEKSQQEEKVATTIEKSQQEPKVENIKIEVKQKKNNNDDLRNEISELKKLILEGRQPKEPKVATTIEKSQQPKKEKLIQVLETPKLISAPIPIPKKKKRSILGGGMVLNLSRF